MTKDQIIRMAREAGFKVGAGLAIVTATELERFAALVAAHEREACAKVCEEQDEAYYPIKASGIECAAAIRARGEK